MKESNYFCVVERIKKFNKKTAKKDIFEKREIYGNFTLINTPIQPKDETLFKVYQTEKDIILTISLFNSFSPKVNSDTVEVFFDIFHDHTGFFQFIFNENSYNIYTHLPYVKAHSNSFEWIEVKKFEWEKQPLTLDKDFINWLFIWFPKNKLFKYKNPIGFNIGRYRSSINEASSWNHCSGPGFPDATSFGHLYLEEPLIVDISFSEFKKDFYFLKGSINSELERFYFNIYTPCGDKDKIYVINKKGTWEAKIPVKEGGRYRIYPEIKRRHIEPEFFYFDVKEKKKFSLCMTYDIPDNLIANFYTPSRLQEEIRLLKNLGINRLYWIDYGNFSAVWKDKICAKNAEISFKKCGDLLHQAIKIAHKEQMEFYGIFKVFDMGSNRKMFENEGELKVKDIEEKYVSVMPEVFGNQQLTLKLNPDWEIDFSYPICRVNIYSEIPICNLDVKDVKIYESENNKEFTPYNQKFSIKQKSSLLKTFRWTPLGKRKEGKKKKLWKIEISNLKVNSPFIAIEIKNKNFKFLCVYENVILIA